MKRTIIWIVCLTALLLAGCGRSVLATTEETVAPTETTVPTEPTETEPPVPQTLSSTVLADRAPVILITLARGDVVDVVGEYDETYSVVKLETGYGLMEKRLLRMEGEESPEQWTGYARWNTQFYTDYNQKASDAEKLSTNTKLQVLDTMDGLCVVQKEDGTIGYVSESSISRSKIRSKSSSGGGGGGGGGASYGADGGDIALSWQGGVTLLSTFVPQTGDTTGKATVLADRAEVLLGWYDREETAQIVTETGFAEPWEGYHTVYLDGLYGYIRQDLLLSEGEVPYAQWEGYARYGSQLFDNYYLSGEPVKKLSTNTKLQVLCELDGCCLVMVDEEIGYLDTTKISERRIVSKPSGGGGGGGGGGTAGPEWSPPAM